MPKFSRRYVESTIASDMSKIVDSMVQKNFVNYLLNQREKKSEPTMADDSDTRIFNDLLKKEFVMWVQSKANAFKSQIWVAGRQHVPAMTSQSNSNNAIVP
ncbi:gastric inhibitory polypeptide [Pimephales promelas]|nr:gastric inhibitory polypeptide [Pimephales promelas]